MFLNSPYSLFGSCAFASSNVCQRFYRPRSSYSSVSPPPKVNTITNFRSGALQGMKNSVPSLTVPEKGNANEDALPSHLFLATSGSSFYFPPDRNREKESTGKREGRQLKMEGRKGIEDKANTVWIRGPVRSFPVDVSTPPLTSEEIERWKLDRLLLGKALIFDLDKAPPKFLLPPSEKIFSLGPEMDKIDALYRRKGRYTPSEVAHAFFPIIPSFYVELRHVFQALPPSIAYRMEQDLGPRGMGANFFAGYPMLFLQRRPSHQKSAVKLNGDFWFVRSHPFFKKADRLQYKNNSDYKAHIGGVVHKNAPVGQGASTAGSASKDIDLHIFDILARHIGWKVVKQLLESIGEVGDGGRGERNAEEGAKDSHATSSVSESTASSPVTSSVKGVREKKRSFCTEEARQSPLHRSDHVRSSKEWAYRSVPLIAWMNRLSRGEMAIVQQVPEKRVILLLSKYVRVFQLLCAHAEDPLLFTDRDNLLYLCPTPGNSSSPKETITQDRTVPHPPHRTVPNTKETVPTREAEHEERGVEDVKTEGKEKEARTHKEKVKASLTEEEEAGESWHANPPTSETCSTSSLSREGQPLGSSCTRATSQPALLEDSVHSAAIVTPVVTQWVESGTTPCTVLKDTGSPSELDPIRDSGTPTASGSGSLAGKFNLDEELLGLDEILSPLGGKSTALLNPNDIDDDEATQVGGCQGNAVSGECKEKGDEVSRNMKDKEALEVDATQDEEEDAWQKDGGEEEKEDETNITSSRRATHTPSAASTVEENGASGGALSLPTRLDVLLVRRLPPHVAPRSLSNFNATITPLPEVTSLAASFLAPPPSLRHQLLNYFTASRQHHRRLHNAVAVVASSPTSDIWRWIPIQVIYKALSKLQKRQLRPFRGLTNYLRLHGELFEVSLDLMHVIAHDPQGAVSPFLPHQKTFSFEERVVLPLDTAEEDAATEDSRGEGAGFTATGGGGACMIGEKERQRFNDLLGDSQIPTTRKQIALLDPENPVLNNDILYEEIARLLPRHPVRKREVLAKLPPILRAAVPTRGLFLHNCSPHIAVFYEKGETMIQRKEDFVASSSSSHRLLPGAETTLTPEGAVEEVRQCIPDGGATIKALRLMYLSSEVVNALIQHYGSIIRGLEAFPQYFCVERREGMPASDSFVRLR